MSRRSFLILIVMLAISWSEGSALADDPCDFDGWSPSVTGDFVNTNYAGAVLRLLCCGSSVGDAATAGSGFLVDGLRVFLSPGGLTSIFRAFGDRFNLQPPTGVAGFRNAHQRRHPLHRTTSQREDADEHETSRPFVRAGGACCR
jgi:hypothetical protein